MDAFVKRVYVSKNHLAVVLKGRGQQNVRNFAWRVGSRVRKMVAHRRHSPGVTLVHVRRACVLKTLFAVRRYGMRLVSLFAMDVGMDVVLRVVTGSWNREKSVMRAC